jgi:hypothetical protein
MNPNMQIRAQKNDLLSYIPTLLCPSNTNIEEKQRCDKGTQWQMEKGTKRTLTHRNPL